MKRPVLLLIPVLLTLGACRMNAGEGKAAAKAAAPKADDPGYTFSTFITETSDGSPAGWSTVTVDPDLPPPGPIGLSGGVQGYASGMVPPGTHTVQVSAPGCVYQNPYTAVVPPDGGLVMTFVATP